ncbi:transmembrane protease serine 3 [Patella vulgata]|uniref:transmembrane protease serine 3 n=1 Tax=Patella vulgata TaxID=6465 RepID=UPI0024A9548E|nr:transmembrane protease serine 3 [Patella vulgata]
MNFITLFIIQVVWFTQVDGGAVTCGSPVVQTPTTSRIIGGSAAKLGAWPWQVLLTEINLPVCGGAVISENIILTAAHCFEDQLSQDPKRWMATVGGIYTDQYEYTQRTYHVQKIIVHEAYNTSTAENDVALLILSTNMMYSNYIRPVCLPDDNESVPVGTICYIAGWGATRGTSNQNTLNQVALPIIGDETCSRPDWYGKDFYPETSFCAGREAGGIDACTGDSGSPLVCQKGSKWTVHGLSSWGYGCAEPRWPGIYTEVSKYTKWIKQHLNKRASLFG